jgi:hypothetical protein
MKKRIELSSVKRALGLGLGLGLELGSLAWVRVRVAVGRAASSSHGSRGMNSISPSFSEVTPLAEMVQKLELRRASSGVSGRRSYGLSKVGWK